MRPDAHEIYERRRSRNRGLGLTLAAFVLLLFAVTVVKLTEGAELRGFDHTFESLPPAAN
jgi:CHASE2 domain-containing sensor protein